MGRRLARISVQLPGAPLGGNGAAIKRGERPAQSLGVVSTYSAALAAVWGESATRSASAAHTRKGCSVTPPKKRGGGPAPRGGSNVPCNVAGGQGTLSAAGGVGTPAHFLLRAPQLAGGSSWVMLGLGGVREASQSEDQDENLVLRSDCGTLAAVCG